MWSKPDPKSPIPISAQIRADLIASIGAGRCRPGDRLPSVRTLAAELLVNPNTVAKVYRELERDGFVISRPGSGVDVTRAAPRLARRELSGEIDDAARDLVVRALAIGLDAKQILALVEAQLLEFAPESPTETHR